MAEHISDSFKFKKGGQFLKLKPEFVAISEGDLIDALILRVFEVELDQIRTTYESSSAKRRVRGQEPEEPEFWIEMPWARLIHKLYMEGHMSENTIKAHVRAIIQRGHLTSRKNPRDPNRKPLQFLLNCDRIQQDLDRLDEDPFLPDTSYLKPGRGSNSYPSNVEGSKTEKNLIPGHQELTPTSRSAGDQHLTPLLDKKDSLEEDTEDTSHTGLPVSLFSQSQQYAETAHSTATPMPPTHSDQDEKPPKGQPSALARKTIQTPSPEALAIIERWRSIFKTTIPITAALITAAEQLVPCDPSVETLRAIKDSCYLNDKNGYYRKRGVKLWDIAREYEGWQSVREYEGWQVLQERGSPPSLSASQPLSPGRTVSGRPRLEVPADALAAMGGM
jgi:hypothetical protein